jgi:hypothetical protein
LGIPEATLRRWRHKLCPSHDEDRVRVVTRAGNTYAMNTAAIGRNGSESRKVGSAQESDSSQAGVDLRQRQIPGKLSSCETAN